MAPELPEGREGPAALSPCGRPAHMLEALTGRHERCAPPCLQHTQAAQEWAAQQWTPAATQQLYGTAAHARSTDLS